MKNFSLILSLLLAASMVFGQNPIDPQDLQKMQREREKQLLLEQEALAKMGTKRYLPGEPSGAKAIECMEDATYSNPPVDFTGAVTSNTDAGYMSAHLVENFEDPIQSIRFFGIQAIFSGAWTPMNNVDPFSFEISFYENGGGLPGDLIQTETVSLNHVNTGEMFASAYNVYHWDYEPTEPITGLPSTFWVSVTNTNTDAWFLWIDQPGGIGNTAQYAEGAWGYTDYQTFGICIVPILADPSAPEAPTSFYAVPADLGVVYADIFWNNPSKTVSGDDLTELTSVALYLTGEEDPIYVNDSPVIGGSETFEFTGTDEGLYKFTVFGTNSAGQGLSATLNVWLGNDVPAAPSNVVLTAVGNDGHVTWTAPTTGLNGGYIDPANTTYKVVRMPGAVVLAEDIDVTEYTDDAVPSIGNYYYAVTSSNDLGVGGTANSNVALLGAEGILLYELFDDIAVGQLPAGWSVIGDGSGNWGVVNTAAAGGAAPEMRLYWSPSFDGLSRLITYPINTGGNTDLRLKLKNYLSNYAVVGNTIAIQASFDDGENWENIWFYEITASIPAQDLELYFSVPDGVTTMHLGWEFQGDAYQINNWNFDNIVLEPVLENDLVAVSISGNTTPSVGMETTHSIAVQNAGTATQTNYTVKLMREGGIELASVEGEPIEFAETIEYEMVWTPEEGDEGPTYVYGYVEFADDELMGNNQTANLNLNIQGGDIIVITIGTGSSLQYIPYNFFYDYSLSQTLYLAEEIGLGGGVITGIQYTNSFDAALVDKNIQIWMGETDDANLSVGWVDPASLQLVFDGTVNFPVGVNSIFIPLDDIYIYGGGNLVIYSYKPDDEWSSGKNFFNSEGAGRTRRAQQDGSPYDPTAPPEGAVANFFPNIGIFFSTAGLGALEGTVTDGTDPIEGALVWVLGTNSKTYTDEDGFYSFPYLLAGTYDIEFSLFGYYPYVEEDVVIEEELTTELDAILSPIPQHSVTGAVVGNDGLDIEGAIVFLDGYDEYLTETDADGAFSFSGVYEGTYQFSVSAAGYDLYTDEVEVNSDVNLDITLIETIITPSGLSVDIDNFGTGNAMFTWGATSEVEFRYDNGVVDSQLGAEGTLNTVLGAAHRNNAVLSEMSWYLTSEGGPHNTVSVWVFGLDASGIPNNSDVLYTAAGVTNVDNQWNTHVFSQPVVAPNGFMIGISYAGFAALGTDNGIDPEWPFITNTQYVNFDVSSESFETIETYGFNINFLIRAIGVDNGELSKGSIATTPETTQFDGIFTTGSPIEPKFAGFPSYSSSKYNANRAFTGFNVYLDDMTTPITQVTENEYLFAGLEEGEYTAGVQSVYTTGSSEIVTIDFEMVYGVEVTIEVSSNAGESTEGALVILTNESIPLYTYEGEADADGEVFFDNVRKGVYTLEVNLASHDLYTETGINIQEEMTIEVELIETIISPFGLLIETEGLETGEAMFSWNNVFGTELFEDFESGSIPTGWARIINNSDTSGPTPGTWTVTNYSSDTFWPFGNYHVGLWWSFSHQDEWLITPEITIGPDYELEFWSAVFLGSTEGDHYYVKISTDGGTSWTMLWDASTQTGEWNYYATPIIIDLSAYNGQDVHLAFNAVDPPSNDGLWYIWFVDNVAVGPVGEKNTLAFADFYRYSANEKNGSTEITNAIARDGSAMVTQNATTKTKSYIGYNVYINGVKVATEITDENFLFSNLINGEHIAGVQSVYTSGVSEIVTIDFEIDNGVEGFTVTFNVNMTNASLDPETDDVYLTGSMFEWAEPGTISTSQTMSRIDESMVWSVTYQLAAGTYQYKYFLNEGWEGGEWEGEPNRVIEVEDDMVVNDTWGTLNVETSVLSKLQVYPNPFNSIINIANAELVSRVVVTNLVGQVVMDTPLNDTYINTSNLSKGVYLISFYASNGERVVRKMIKQ